MLDMQENSSHPTRFEDDEEYTCLKPALDVDDHFGAHIRLKQSMDEIALVEEQDLALNAHRRLTFDTALCNTMDELVVSAKDTEAETPYSGVDEGYATQEDENLCAQCRRCDRSVKSSSREADKATKLAAQTSRAHCDHRSDRTPSLSSDTGTLSDIDDDGPTVYEGRGVSGNFGMCTSTRTERIARVANPAQRPLLYFKTGRNRRNIERLLMDFDRTRVQ